MRPLPTAPNQTSLSGPETKGPSISSRGLSPALNLVIAPDGEIRSTLGGDRYGFSLNQMFPSGPAAGPLRKENSSDAIPPNSVICPVVVIRPIGGLADSSANQRFPSGPATISPRLAFGLRPAENSVIVPCGVIRPIVWFDGARSPVWVNQTFPSEPMASFQGTPLALIPALNSAIAPPGVIRPIAGVGRRRQTRGFRRVRR